MKKIVIYQKQLEPLIIIDYDNTNREDYTKELIKLVESTKVCILETSHVNVIIKPSEISSIIVEELSENKELQSEKSNQNKIFNSTDIIKD